VGKSHASREQHSFSQLCRVFDVPRSSCYDRIKRRDYMDPEYFCGALLRLNQLPPSSEREDTLLENTRLKRLFAEQAKELDI